MKLISRANIVQDINHTLKRNDFLVGVLGGTSFDAHYGARFLENKNINTLPMGVSSSPIEQTVLQLSKKKLMTRIIEIIDILLLKKCSIIFIYCNSLSVSLDLIMLRKKVRIPIITTIDFYNSIAINEKSIAVMAANCQSLASIEKIMLKTNPNIIIIGFAALNIVDDIEKEILPGELIEKYDLVSLCCSISQCGTRKILIGCTHFNYFYDKLVKAVALIAPKIQFIEPSGIMYQSLKTHIEKV